jgi:hypothetical protein
MLWKFQKDGFLCGWVEIAAQQESDLLVAIDVGLRVLIERERRTLLLADKERGVS